MSTAAVTRADLFTVTYFSREVECLDWLMLVFCVGDGWFTNVYLLPCGYVMIFPPQYSLVEDGYSAHVFEQAVSRCLCSSRHLLYVPTFSMFFFRGPLRWRQQRSTMGCIPVVGAKAVAQPQLLSMKYEVRVQHEDAAKSRVCCGCGDKKKGTAIMRPICTTAAIAQLRVQKIRPNPLNI